MDAGDASTAQSSTENSAPRVVGRPFSKGRSGNPGGRPKGSKDLIARIAERGDDIFDALLEIGLTTPEVLAAQGKSPLGAASPGDRVKALTVLAAYVAGKPIAQLHIKNTNSSAETLASELRRLRQQPETAKALLVLAEASAAPRIEAGASGVSE